MSESPKSLEINDNSFRPNLGSALVLQAGSLAVFFLMLFAPTLPPLYKDWREFDTFSHGLLVPFISVYLAWQRKDILRYACALILMGHAVDRTGVSSWR